MGTEEGEKYAKQMVAYGANLKNLKRISAKNLRIAKSV